MNSEFKENLSVYWIAAETLDWLNMKFPEPTVDIKDIKRKYHGAEKNWERASPTNRTDRRQDRESFINFYKNCGDIRDGCTRAYGHCQGDGRWRQRSSGYG